MRRSRRYQPAGAQTRLICQLSPTFGHARVAHSRCTSVSAHTMKFAIDHVFPGITVLDYETLYFDEAFNETLGTALAMGRRLLKLERTPQRIVRHVQFEPARDPQSPAGKAFGTSRASFVEQLEFDRQAQHGTWVTIPNLW